MFRKSFALASEDYLCTAVSLRQNYTPLVRTATAGVLQADIQASTLAPRQRAAHVVVREFSSSTTSRSDNPARSHTSTHPTELTLFIKRPGSVGYTTLIATSSSYVGKLIKDIRKEFRSLRDVDDDLLSLQLQVAADDGTAGSGKNNCGATQTKLVPLDGTDTIYNALTTALGRPITSQDKLRIIVSAARGHDELTLWIKQSGAPNTAKFVVKSASVVADLKERIIKKLGMTVPIVNLSLLLQVAAADGSAGSDKSRGGAAETKLVLLDNTATVSGALKAALGREATFHDNLTIIMDVRTKPAGLMPYNSALGIDEALWIDMSQDVQEHAVIVVSERKKLAAVPMLCDMRSKMTVKQAKQNQVKVLYACGDDVKLGVFDVRAVNARFVTGPKGFDDMSDTSHFFTPERAFIVEEFLNEMDMNKLRIRRSGVLLSGPNGVGKSAVGLHAFLCCVAQRRFAVYIPEPKNWVTAAESGKCDEFLLEQFFLQNLDLIAAEPALRIVFKNRFRGDPNGIDVMAAFREFLTIRPGPVVAVIVDEVQWISRAIELATSQPTLKHITASDYFSRDWASWSNNNRCFVRMDIASSHGLREFNLPDGEDWRLRFVRPWSLDTAAVALAHNASPAFVVQTNAHSRILCGAGGIIRQLLKCKSSLPAKTATATAQQLKDMMTNLRGIYKRACSKWLEMLDSSEQLEAARTIIPLIRGQVDWYPMKGAYDFGLVALTGDEMNIAPVSPVAASEILQCLASVSRVKFTPLSTIGNESERGYELERQVLLLLNPSRASYATVSLDGNPAPAIHVSVDSILTMLEPKDTVMDPIANFLCVPLHENFECDFMIVPATPVSEVAGMATEQAPVQIWECSVTDPRDSGRVQKCLGWFKSGGLIASVQAAHPLRPITVVFCWPGHLVKSNHYNYKGLVKAAAACNVKICVLDSSGLSNLGVML